MEHEEEKEENGHHHRRTNSPEIVEILEEEDDDEEDVSMRRNKKDDVYVAVGRNDVHVVKWAIDHLVSPSTQLFLVHVFPPIQYISTTVGVVSSRQLSNNEMRVYRNEEENRRKHLLDKYIRLCIDAKIAVDTMVIESDSTTKSILNLIRVINITKLVMGTSSKTTSSSVMRRLMKGRRGRGEKVKYKAPEFCDVILVHNKGNDVDNGERKSSNNEEEAVARQGSPEIFDTNIQTRASKGPKAEQEDTKHSIHNTFSKLMCFSHN